MPETVAWMVETHPSQRTDTVRFRAQQRRVETTNAAGKNMAVQASNMPIAEQEPARPSDWQIAEVLAQYAGLAVRQEPMGDLGAGLLDELDELRHARMVATSRLLEAN